MQHSSKKLNLSSKMDILEKLIALSQITGNININCRLQGQWQLTHPTQQGQAIVHIVAQGSGYLHFHDDNSTQRIQAGDVIFFAKAQAHSLSSHHGIHEHTALRTHQQGAFIIKENTAQAHPEVSLFCAAFHYAPQSELIQSLPDSLLLHLSPQQQYPILQLLQFEASQEPLGGQIIANALASILLVWILRTYLSQEQNDCKGILKAYQDKRLSALLQALLQQPEYAWTIENMSAYANLSRAQLTRLFKQYLAKSPHQYLHSIRLQKSAVLLKNSADSLLSIALATGFQNETHYGKTFKKYYGVTPSQYRKNSDK